MAFAGLFFSRTALEWMGTPDDVIDLAALYMKIYFIGMPFFMLYNYGAAILRAVGDTKRPLLFLVVSGLVNAGLNMILVICFHMAVEGVAIATVISQLLSCIMVLTCLYRTQGCYQFRFSKLGLKSIYVLQIFQVGIPAGIQSTVIKLFRRLSPQSSVNSFGSVATAVIHCGQQYLRIFIHFSQLCDAGVHELYQPELRRGKNRSGSAPRFNRLSDFILCVFPDHGLLCMVFRQPQLLPDLIRRVLRLFRAALRF